MASRLADRRRDHKKTTTHEDSLRKREDETLMLRKAKKDDALTKRRQLTAENVPDVSVCISASVDHNNIITPSLASTTATAPIQTIPAQVSEISNALARLQSPLPTAHLEAANYFRRVLSLERNPPIDQVIRAGVVPHLISFLGRHENPQLQFEAAWALTNIASGTSEQASTLVDQGIVPAFIQLLSSANEDVREQSIWGLGNIAGDSPRFRDLVLQSGIMAPHLALFRPDSKLSILRNATWALSNLCRGKPQPSIETVAPAIPYLAKLVTHFDDEVITDATWALSYISDGPNDRIQAVISSGVVPRLVELLRHANVAVQTPALRCLGNIVTGDDNQTQMAIACGMLGNLSHLFSSTKKTIRKEVCWAISNITAGTPHQIQAIIESGVLPYVAQAMGCGDFDIQKEAVWALSNATTGGNDEQIKYLANIGTVQALASVLTVRDSKIVNVCLEGLENLLRVGAKNLTPNGTNPVVDLLEEADAIDALEGLQRHQNQDIYERVIRILETYFVADEDEDISVAPVVDDAQQGYSFGVTQQTQGQQMTFNFA
eukprot:TRINITY_DN14463_c0_g1_i1.p1 TRINITY_DN14463_c0_g1~~TRINITY_DN14463_c0_g1_i1.p1  ORF type:complete len:548 (-),score=125.95 TRINITY_DN14463_c0_g1_i1:415-2058(-)